MIKKRFFWLAVITTIITLFLASAINTAAAQDNLIVGKNLLWKKEEVSEKYNIEHDIEYTIKCSSKSGTPDEYQCSNLVDGEPVDYKDGKHLTKQFKPPQYDSLNRWKAEESDDNPWILINFTEPRFINKVILRGVLGKWEGVISSDVGNLGYFSCGLSFKDPAWKTRVCQSYFNITKVKYIKINVTRNAATSSDIGIGELKIYLSQFGVLKEKRNKKGRVIKIAEPQREDIVDGKSLYELFVSAPDPDSDYVITAWGASTTHETPSIDALGNMDTIRITHKEVGLKCDLKNEKETVLWTHSGGPDKGKEAGVDVGNGEYTKKNNGIWEDFDGNEKGVITGIALSASDGDTHTYFTIPPYTTYRILNPETCTFQEEVKTIGKKEGQELKLYAHDEEGDYVITGIGLNRNRANMESGAIEIKEFIPLKADYHGAICKARTGKESAWLDDAPAVDPAGENNYCCQPEDEGIFSPKVEGSVHDEYEYFCHNSEWLPASTFKFKIYTLKNFDSNYDVVSNNRHWHACKPPEQAGILDEFSLDYDETLPYGGSNASYRLLCYNQGYTSAFAECSAEEEAHNKDNPSKVRNLGEPATMLHNISEQFEYKFGVVDDIINLIPAKELTTEYPSYQGFLIEDSLTNTSFFPSDFVDFFVKTNNISAVNLMFLLYKGEGPKNDIDSYMTYLFNEPLIAYVTDNIAPDKWMHISVPVSQIYETGPFDVSAIVFFTDVTKLREDEIIKLDIERFFLRDDNIKYCSEPVDFDYWITDLDNSLSACDSFPSFGWTGTKCCGDDWMISEGSSEGISWTLEHKEYYIDTEGGCWKGNPVKNNSKIIDDVMFLDGKFYICGSRELSLPVEKEISENVPSCTIKGNFFCSKYYVAEEAKHHYKWSNESSPDDIKASQRNTTRDYPDLMISPTLTRQGCCAPDYCWNGDECIASMHEDINLTYPFPGNLQLRCIHGQWTSAELKYDWNNNKSGYCPELSQCLVDPDGKPEQNNNVSAFRGLNKKGVNPICINDSQFIEDHYCRDGEWTTRTRLIAQQLLELKSTSPDFIIYCDNYKNSLVDYNYGDVEKYLAGPEIEIENGFPILERSCFDEHYRAPCVNNFCIMKYNNNIIFGTSLNKEINVPDISFLNTLMKDTAYCNNVDFSKNEFQKCGNNDVWYNPKTNSVIYSKQGIALEETTWGKIKDFFSRIFGFITRTWKPKDRLGTVINLTGLEATENYDRLYLQKSGDKLVSSTLTGIKPDKIIMTVQYENFTLPICESIKRLGKGMSCNKTDNRFVVLGTTQDTIAYWQDLTSKLRLTK